MCAGSDGHDRELGMEFEHTRTHTLTRVRVHRVRMRACTFPHMRTQTHIQLQKCKLCIVNTHTDTLARIMQQTILILYRISYG